MKKIILSSFFLVTALSFSQISESYIARISPADHFNSNGERLRNAAQIIRQDRANYHKFGKSDPEDQGDIFFADANNREALENMLRRGRITAEANNLIVNGDPLIKVDIYSGGYIDVTVYDDSPQSNVHVGRTPQL